MTLNTTEARERFSEVVSRSAYGKERVRLSRYGKEIAAIVPIEDLLLLERLIEEEEDRIDAAAAQKAWAEQGEDPLISFEELKQKMRL